jgi:hypothetical protein
VTKLTKINDSEYSIVDNGPDNFHHIELNETSPFKEVVFQFGGVKLTEEDDTLRVSFDYEVFKNPKSLDTRSNDFVDYIGNILMTNLNEILIYNNHNKGKNVN